MIARTAAAAAVILAAAGARALDPWGSLEIGAGPFSPRVDSEFNGATPYRDVFGGAPGPMFRLHVARVLWSRNGTAELGFRTGFFCKAGHAVQSSNPSVKTGDRSALYVVPTSLTLTYRTDQLPQRFGIPVVFYGRVALERYNWWVTKQDKWTQNGATNGYSATLGTALVLDFLDVAASRDLELETGILHTGLYFDVTWDRVNDFGSKKSWDLSAKKLFWSAGLMFVY